MGVRQAENGRIAPRRMSRGAKARKCVLPVLALVAWLPVSDAEPPSQVIQASIERPQETFDGRRLVSGGYLAGVQRRTDATVHRQPPFVRVGPDFDGQRLCLRGISQDSRYEVTATLGLPPVPRPALVELPRLPIDENGAQRYLAALPWNDLGLLVSPGTCDAGDASASLLPLIWSDSTSADTAAPLQIAVNAMGGERVAARLLDEQQPGRGLTLDCGPSSEGQRSDSTSAARPTAR